MAGKVVGFQSREARQQQAEAAELAAFNEECKKDCLKIVDELREAIDAGKYTAVVYVALGDGGAEALGDMAGDLPGLELPLIGALDKAKTTLVQVVQDVEDEDQDNG